MQEVQVPIHEKINLTIKEAAELSNIGEQTIRKEIGKKGCPFVLKIGRKSVVRRKAFEKYLDNISQL